MIGPAPDLTMSPSDSPDTAGGPGAEERVDRLLAELALPVPERPSLLDGILGLSRELTSTPRRAALATSWVFAFVLMWIVWLVQPTVTARTSLGAVTARCGIDVFVYGYPNPPVARTCRSAEAVHFALFVPAALVVVTGIVAAVVFAVRYDVFASGVGGGKLLPALRRARVQVSLAGLGAVAVVIGLMALRPATAEFVRSGVLITSQCGADTYFGGYPDRAVLSACGRAYAGHAHVLEAACLVALIGTAALIQVLYATFREPRHRRRLTAVLAGVVLAATSAIALRPVDVTVPHQSAPVVASCGVDTFLVGYPQAAVQTVCRSNYGSHAALGLVAGTLAIAMLGWGALCGRRQRDGLTRLNSKVPV